MVSERVGVRFVVIISLPFVEVVGDIKPAVVRSSILEVNDDKLMVLGSARRKGLFQFKDVTVLGVVICNRRRWSVSTDH